MADNWWDKYPDAGNAPAPSGPQADPASASKPLIPSSATRQPFDGGVTIEPDENGKSHLVFHIGGLRLHHLPHALPGEALDNLPPPEPNVPWGTPNVEAAAYAQRGPGVVGKLLGAAGLDASGKRAETSWSDALENTVKGSSVENAAYGAYEALKRLEQHGGLPPEGDPYREQAPVDALKVAGATAAPSLVLGERPPGSLGMFVGRKWAEGRAANGGKLTGKKVLDMAETMEQNGLPDDFIRSAGREMIARGDDPSLGDFHRGADGMWKLELSDQGMKYAAKGPAQSTIGAEIAAGRVSHPDLFEGLPALRETELERFKGYGGSFAQGFPGEPTFGIPPQPPTIRVGQSAAARADDFLHELQHNVSLEEGFARGGDPRMFAEGGRFASMRKPGESPTNAYRRLVGEWDAKLTETRRHMSAEERIGTPIEVTLRDLQRRKILPQGEPIVKFYEDRFKVLRDALKPDEASSIRQNPGEPSAFEQAQEEHWADTGKLGFAREQAIERKDTPPAERASASVLEKLEREDRLGRAADKLAADISETERNLKRSGVSSEKIAESIREKYGEQAGKIDPADIANGTGWWRIASPDRYDSSSAWGKVRWSQEEREVLARGLRDKIPYADIAKQIMDVSGRALNPSSVSNARRNFGIPGRRKNPDLSELWPREANVMLAHLWEAGAPVAKMAGELNKAFGHEYTPKVVGEQLDRIMRGTSPHVRGTHETWQPDALELLKTESAAGTSASQIADLIQKQTGQVASRSAVLGKVNRLREQQMRENLAEDLAKIGKKMPSRALKSSGIPIGNQSDPDRMSTWGGFF